jgi:hypothetical protein
MKDYMKYPQKKSPRNPRNPNPVVPPVVPVVLLVAAFLDLPLHLRRSLGRLGVQVILQGRRGATRQLFAGDLDADPTTLRARALPGKTMENWVKNMGKLWKIWENWVKPWKTMENHEVFFFQNWMAWIGEAK